MRTVAFVFLALSLPLAGCGARDADSARMPVPFAVYEKAVANPARPAADRERDARSHPAEVMQFLGFAPGMRVLDLYAGGGYNSELLSYIVGPSGSVVTHTNRAYLGFTGDEFHARFDNNRLPNVEILRAENNELELPAANLDGVLMSLVYHDIYYVDEANGWPKLDGVRLLAELYQGMKPGAILGIIDHYADTGASRDTGGTVHRIDPGIVIAEVEAAGFTLEDQSELLRNPQDDHKKSVFDPAVRGKTDRFVLRFRKPAEPAQKST